MIPYYFDLAMRSFRRNKVLTALMVCAIALGIGTSMTTLTVLHVLSDDPIPHKSDRLFRVQLDPQGMKGYEPGEEPPHQLTRFDAEKLLAAKRATRQVVMNGGNAPVSNPAREGRPIRVRARHTSADFFPMFDVPLVSGSGWTGADDEARARVAVISQPLAEKLFGAEDPIGETIRIRGNDFRVVGIVGKWRPTPHFFDLNTGYYRETDQVLVPFSTAVELDFGHAGTMSCWDDVGGKPFAIGAACTWIQFWIELPSASDRADYIAFLEAYSEEQRKAGRFERPTNIKLRNVTEWLEFAEVVPSDVRLQVWLAFGFLLVCLLNTIGLMLAMFMRRSADIAVRRALGASRATIFLQLIVEAGSIGLVGSGFGLLLVWAGVWAVAQQPTDYAQIVHVDSVMLAATIGLAVVASIGAALLPAWRACSVSPAQGVKSQ